MKKGLLLLSIIAVTFAGSAFLLLFEGNIKNASTWWESFTRNKDWLPFSPYTNRIENADNLRILDATQIKIVDNHLFWNGSGAIIAPEINQQGMLISLQIKNGGTGYSQDVEAKITGSGQSNIQVGKISVNNGKITDIQLKKKSIWHLLPTAFWGNENLPFTGIVEKKFPNGQNLTVQQYSNGLLHGVSKRFTPKGLPVYKIEYHKGLKHGTHIYYYDIPINPDSDQNSNKSLWAEINESSYKENASKDISQINENIIEKFRLKGGSFQVKLLEHWKNNQRDGLFEAFDRYGNKMYKDEYKFGLRTYHRTFDKDKTKTFNRKSG
jgi:antitoxin component YwqK of YwqJK toxin-antitoxin module